jgi:hypothetical protein
MADSINFAGVLLAVAVALYTYWYVWRTCCRNDRKAHAQRTDSPHTADNSKAEARATPTPDHQRIAETERELGINDPTPEPGTHSNPAVCLIKKCAGSDTEYRTCSGILIRRVHEH